MTPPAPPQDELLARLAEAERRADYYEQRNEALSAQVSRADAAASALRHELERNRRGFTLLARLTGSLEGADNLRDLFALSCRQLNGMLMMERTVLLEPAGDGRQFRPTVLQGYGSESALIAGSLVTPPAALAAPGGALLINSATPLDPTIQQFADALQLPYFVAVPVVLEERVEAILITGRTQERLIYTPRLEAGDLETIRAVTGFLGAVLARQNLREARHRAATDSLTGIYNKRHLMEHGDQLLAGAGGEAALLVLDIDHFKQVNDRFGHLAGDRVLEALGQLLREQLPDPQQAQLFRFGGEEFIAILRHCNGEQAWQVAETLRTETARLQPSGIPFSVSIGVALSSAPHHPSLAQLIARADSALYAAKRAGRNRVVVARAAATAEIPFDPP